jgi:calcineurin-like phosphoesterase family protein
MTIFFGADMHLSHEAMITKCGRPFYTVEEMNLTILRNWCEKVTKHDTVYLLGDVAMRSDDGIANLLDSLPGNIFLIKGNHDHYKKMSKSFEARFGWIKEYYELKVKEDSETQRIVLFHYPIISWNGMHRGSWALHGHCHGSLKKLLLPSAKRLDVCFDDHKFNLWSYEEVKEYMSTQNFTPVDHHQGDHDET